MIFAWASSTVVGCCGSAQCRERLGCRLPLAPEMPVNASRAPGARLCTVSWAGSALGCPASGKRDKPHRWVMSSSFSPDNLDRSNCFIHMNLPHEIKVFCSKPSDWAAWYLYFIVWWIFIGDVIIFMSRREATIYLTGGLLLCYPIRGVNGVRW